MNRQTVKAVRKLAADVQELCEEVLDELKASESGIVYAGTAKTGELRRRSLDLSRALSAMRKPS